jgi:hypothetical protein
MDAKITLSFDESVISKAKAYAEANNISLSRLTEVLLIKLTSANYASLDDLPVSDWVNMVAEGEVEYRRTQKTRKDMKDDFYSSKK